MSYFSGEEESGERNIFGSGVCSGNSLDLIPEKLKIMFANNLTKPNFLAVTYFKIIETD